MLIEKIAISDYRSCINTELQLQPDLSVLIGPNGSGKTNILTACLLLQAITHSEPRARRGDQYARNECKIKATFLEEARKSILTATIDLQTNPDNTDDVLDSRTTWYAKDYTGNQKRFDAPLWFYDEYGEYGIQQRRVRISRMGSRRVIYDYPFWDDMPEEFSSTHQKIASFLQGVRYYSASQFTNPAECPPSFEVQGGVRRRRPAGVLRGHARFLFDIYRSQEKEEFQQFVDVIGPNGIGLVDKISFKEVPTSSVEYSVRTGGEVTTRRQEKFLVIPQFELGANTLSPSQLSEGTFKTISLLFYLMTDQSTAMLIEEPEVCVHHGLLSSIVELIKSYSAQKQIIISTHSDFVLDKVEPRSVYKIENRGKQGTKASSVEKNMSAKERSALKSYLASEGNLGEYWRHGGFD